MKSRLNTSLERTISGDIPNDRTSPSTESESADAAAAQGPPGLPNKELCMSSETWRCCLQGCNLSVAWRSPGGVGKSVPGRHLSKPHVARKTSWENAEPHTSSNRRHRRCLFGGLAPSQHQAPEDLRMWRETTTPLLQRRPSPNNKCRFFLRRRTVAQAGTGWTGSRLKSLPVSGAPVRAAGSSNTRRKLRGSQPRQCGLRRGHARCRHATFRRRSRRVLARMGGLGCTLG